MPKQKTKKSIFKRIKVTAKGKLLRKHQLGSGHLKRHKSKNALQRQSKSSEYFKGEAKKYRKILGI